jgi:ubiquitin-protein ligase
MGAARLRKQITSLFTYNDHIKELTPEKQYELPFSAGSLDISLLINLSSEFPHEPPIITVTPTDLRHPWIESNIVTWPEKLHVKNWNSQSNLGKILQEVREEFIRSPPVRGAQSDVIDDDWIAVTSPVSYVILHKYEINIAYGN